MAPSTIKFAMSQFIIYYICYIIHLLCLTLDDSTHKGTSLEW